MHQKLRAVPLVKHALSGTVMVAGCSLFVQACGDDDAAGVIVSPDASVDASIDTDTNSNPATDANTNTTATSSDDSVIIAPTDSGSPPDETRDSSTELDAGADALTEDVDAGDASDAADADAAELGKDGPPGNEENLHPHEVGDEEAGRTVFRMETFGNENFWTDVVQLPQGIVAQGFTPVQALKAGYNINIDAVTAAFTEEQVAAISAELAGNLDEATILNDPATTIALINANAVIGVVAVDSDESGTIDVAGGGDKVGVACAFCHAVTDKSVFSLEMGGSIGVEVDGPSPHFLNVGATFAIANQTRALYPISQVALTANGGATLGRAPAGLTEDSAEEDFDAYFNNPEFYPVGMFDDQPDGNGVPMHITPMFRADLSAPYGSEGAISKLDNFSNLVYTVLFDLRNIRTESGRAFMSTLAGPAGIEIADDYEVILNDLGVSLEPQVMVSSTGMPGMEPTPVGIRVDNAKLLDMSAYMDGLAAPAQPDGDVEAVARGREMFRRECTSCHNVDQGQFVPSMIIPMIDIFPGDDPVTLAERDAPLNDILNTVDSIFDDKMAVVNASIRGDIRGIALPLLLDLARKPVFLHDNSVATLDLLLDPARGEDVPHPFYIDDADDREDMIKFLEAQDTE